MTKKGDLAELAREMLDLELETFEINDYEDKDNGLMLGSTSTTSTSTTSSTTSCSSSCG